MLSASSSGYSQRTEVENHLYEGKLGELCVGVEDQVLVASLS